MTALNKYAALRQLAEESTQGEWWSDVVETDGEYGDGEDRASGYHSYAVYVGSESLLDMTNSTAACIHTEWDHDYLMAWDETAKRNAEFIAAANPATVLVLLDELESVENELNACKSILEKIKSTSCHVDTSPGAFIPNSLDAWGRPVPQYLPYDFSGNPGVSETQYCNGWNDAGGYWLNHVKYLQEFIRAAGIGVKGE
ncbi:ead/Ea22-like family protein [Citrobacter freundii]|uniref:ead/Ea22-like family protein n=1 Tax=Citrobacter freundii TaxID=546 RepID=UPI003F897094